MKKVLFVVAALCAAFANGAPAPIAVGPEAFDPHGAHIQGIAATDDALYVAQMTRLVKLDWEVLCQGNDSDGQEPALGFVQHRFRGHQVWKT